MRKLIADIEAKPGGAEWVMDQLADGRAVGKVATELGVSRRYLYMWRDRPGHKETLKPMWEAAIKLSAEADLENSTADFDRLDREICVNPETGEMGTRVPATAEVQLVTGRAKFRQWLAGRKDPEKYGDKQAGVNVNLNLGDMHVAAVEAVKARHRLAPVEVVEDEPAEDPEDPVEGLMDLMG